MVRIWAFLLGFLVLLVVIAGARRCPVSEFAGKRVAIIYSGDRDNGFEMALERALVDVYGMEYGTIDPVFYVQYMVDTFPVMGEDDYGNAASTTLLTTEAGSPMWRERRSSNV